MKLEGGLYTVIPTFFKESEVDIDQLIRAVEIQVNCGVKNVVLLGTTSETPTLSVEEQEKIVKNVWEKFHNMINIIVGIGGNNTKQTLEFGFKFENFCDAFMITVPYYNKPNQEGIYQHFSTIANLISKPILLYNIPSRCGVSIEPTTIAKLFNDHENIQAIKEASGNLNQILEIRKMCDIIILSGDDALTLPTMSVGGEGVVSVASNLLPKQMLLLINLFKSNKLSEAIELNDKLYPIFKCLFIDTNPVPLKFLLNKVNLAENCNVRLPLVSLNSIEKINLLNEIVKKINFVTEAI